MLYHKSHLSDLPSVSQITHVQSPMSAFKSEHSIFFPEIIISPGDSCSNTAELRTLQWSTLAVKAMGMWGGECWGEGNADTPPSPRNHSLVHVRAMHGQHPLAAAPVPALSPACRAITERQEGTQGTCTH